MPFVERLFAVVGAAMLAGGWAWSVDQSQPEDQRGALVLAACGLLVSGGAAVAATSRRARSIAAARSDGVALLRGVVADRMSASRPAGPVRLVRVAGGTWTHRSDCLLVRGKTTRSARRTTVSLQSCPVCRPDDQESCGQKVLAVA